MAKIISRVLSQLKHESKTLLTWIDNNGLKASPGIFHLLLSDQGEFPSLSVENNDIKSKKMLGITFDNKLTFQKPRLRQCRNEIFALFALLCYPTLVSAL